MFKYTQLEPVEPKHWNNEIGGRPLEDHEVKHSESDKVEGIRAYSNDGVHITTWRMKSFLARLVFLFTGKINLIQLGNKFQASALSIGDPFNE